MFVDTNVFLRFLTKDDPEKAEACMRLFKRAQNGDLVLYTSEMVIAELVWVLQSPKTYNLSPAQIRNILLPLLSLDNLLYNNKNIYPEIFDCFVDFDVDFIDAYHAVIIKKQSIQEICSYDRHFDKIPGIKRKEP
ncbi:PIN domain-containing protein [Dethiobacter alkaliphilus]|uniref:PIN domain-containing protein n=1 Tax=Dethiobacter alkaliphilus TaxID=427926 RepID=UPI002226E81E|nr:PIN domain-containing protein [Dethiobacter alkaliphilus]MCW3489940.1 PIN domain-containing protein [Dethiobacter alkaliphilus]